MDSMNDIELWKGLAGQVPALVLFSLVMLTLVALFLRHLRTEGEDTRKVLRSLSSDIRENTQATVTLGEVMRTHGN